MGSTESIIYVFISGKRIFEITIDKGGSVRMEAFFFHIELLRITYHVGCIGLEIKKSRNLYERHGMK